MQIPASFVDRVNQMLDALGDRTATVRVRLDLETIYRGSVDGWYDAASDCEARHGEIRVEALDGSGVQVGMRQVTVKAGTGGAARSDGATELLLPPLADEARELADPRARAPMAAAAAESNQVASLTRALVDMTRNQRALMDSMLSFLVGRLDRAEDAREKALLAWAAQLQESNAHQIENAVYEALADDEASSDRESATIRALDAFERVLLLYDARQRASQPAAGQEAAPAKPPCPEV